jgi:hypothetical protein
MEILKRIIPELKLRSETAKFLPGSKNKAKVLVLSGAFVKSSSHCPSERRA